MFTPCRVFVDPDLSLLRLHYCPLPSQQTGLKMARTEDRKSYTVQDLTVAGEGEAQNGVYIFPPFLLVAWLANSYTTAVCWP